MNTLPKSLRSTGVLFLLALLFFSCSKDTDLLADYVAVQNSHSLVVQNLVINDSYSMGSPTTIVLDVLSNDSFINPDKVKIVETTQPENGTVTINEDKTITYTPNNNNGPTDTEEGVKTPGENVNDNVTESPQTGDTESSNDTPADTEIESDSSGSDSENPEEKQPVNEPQATQEQEDSEEEPTSDNFNYVVKTSDEEGNEVFQEGTVEISFDYGELRAFPGAEGFGKYAVGGRGGRTIYVTNLNDSGEGSLRDAIGQTGRRTIVFKVNGYITINSPLVIRNPNITIAGQTAPGEGVTLRINPNKNIPSLQINTDDVIIRGLRFRPGTTSPKAVNGDALLLTNGKRIIIDHCSFSWATDEVVNPFGATDITLQNCIFSEGLMYSNHTYTTDPTSSGYYGPHSMGMLIGSKSNRISIYNSIFAHNNQRNPIIGGGGSEFELVNNVYYNWGDFATVLNSDNSYHSNYNIINNLHIPGKNSRSNRYPILIGDKIKVYAKGNTNQFRTNNTDPEIMAIGKQSVPFNKQADPSSLVSTAFDFPLKSTKLIEPNMLLQMVTSSAGAFKKDAVGKRVVADIKNGTGSLIDSPYDVGGYPTLGSGKPYLDSDQDGMSDEWENKHNLNPMNPKDAAEDFNEDGFTNLEDFLHFLSENRAKEPLS